MANSRLTLRTIPLRLMNRPVARASVLGRCATWHCPCGDPIALQGKSGRLEGPTVDSVVQCGRCARVYFVIPLDRSFGAPVEVVELFGMPAPTDPAPDLAPSPEPEPSHSPQSANNG